MQNIKKEDIDVKKYYGEDTVLKVEEFKNKYKISENGLETEEAKEKLKNLGLNQIKQSKSKKWYNYLLSSLFSTFNSILLGIGFILIYTDIILPEKPSPANIIVIIALIIVSTLLEFFEVFRSNKAADKLKELVDVSKIDL